MKRSYTHVDGDGIRWRFEGERPISEIADRVMDDCRKANKQEQKPRRKKK